LNVKGPVISSTAALSSQSTWSSSEMNNLVMRSIKDDVRKGKLGTIEFATGRAGEERRGGGGGVPGPDKWLSGGFTPRWLCQNSLTLLSPSAVWIAEDGRRCNVAAWITTIVCRMLIPARCLPFHVPLCSSIHTWQTAPAACSPVWTCSWQPMRRANKGKKGSRLAASEPSRHCSVNDRAKDSPFDSPSLLMHYISNKQ